MTDCWQHDPKARPTFTELVKTIGDFQDNIKVGTTLKESFSFMTFSSGQVDDVLLSLT